MVSGDDGRRSNVLSSIKHNSGPRECVVLQIKPILRTWGRILGGRVPSLSIEITRECPLRCPGCYAYEDAHLGGTNLRSLSDFKGDDMVRRVPKHWSTSNNLCTFPFRRRRSRWFVIVNWKNFCLALRHVLHVQGCNWHVQPISAVLGFYSKPARKHRRWVAAGAR